MTRPLIVLNELEDACALAGPVERSETKVNAATVVNAIRPRWMRASFMVCSLGLFVKILSSRFSWAGETSTSVVGSRGIILERNNYQQSPPRRRGCQA